MNRTYDDAMFIDTFEHEYTWLNGFMRNVFKYPDNIAIIDPKLNKKWSYSDLNHSANQLANAMADDGIKKNDVIMTVLRNSPAFALTYIAPRKIGAVLLAANFNLSSGEMALLINHNKPKILIYSANITAVVIEAISKAEHKPDRIILADNIEALPLPENHLDINSYMAPASSKNPQQPHRPHIYDEVLRLCTSGTTSLPKSVPINDINEVISAHDVIMHYPLSRKDVTLTMTPWFHRGGIHCAGPGPVFYAGGAVVVMRRFQPQNALYWVSKYNITFLIGAPANLNMLCKTQQKKNYCLTALRGIVTMGAPLSKTDCEKYMQFLTPNILNGYGTTESGLNSYLPPSNLPEYGGTIGNGNFDDEVRIVKIYKDKKAEPDELVLNDNKTEGEIIIRSPGKSTYTYFKNPEMSEKKFYKGWMYTGDTGIWNENLIVTVNGRKDDMMVVSGENIFPSQIEEVLNSHPKVKDSIVTSLPDSIRGECVAAYILKEDKSLTIKELFDFCNSNQLLSLYKKPRYFAFTEKIPFNATGKKLRKDMKNQALKDLENGFFQKN